MQGWVPLYNIKQKYLEKQPLKCILGGTSAAGHSQVIKIEICDRYYVWYVRIILSMCNKGQRSSCKIEEQRGVECGEDWAVC